MPLLPSHATFPSSCQPVPDSQKNASFDSNTLFVQKPPGPLTGLCGTCPKPPSHCNNPKWNHLHPRYRSHLHRHRPDTPTSHLESLVHHLSTALTPPRTPLRTTRPQNPGSPPIRNPIIIRKRKIAVETVSEISTLPCRTWCPERKGRQKVRRRCCSRPPST
jgi:hypothetical protein